MPFPARTKARPRARPVGLPAAKLWLVCATCAALGCGDDGRTASVAPGRAEPPADQVAHALAEELGREPLPTGPSERALVLAGSFDDEARARGLDYANRSGEPDKPTILEANGPGVAVLDLETDGDLDLVFGQGVASLRALVEGPGADVEVFANDGEAHFARRPGPGLSGWWTGLAAGDVDSDGDTDLVSGAYGDLVLLLQGAGGALDVAEASGLLPSAVEAPGARLVPGAEREPGTFPWWATSLALFDADQDGYLDLYVGQYLELDPLRPPLGELGEGALALPCSWKGLAVFCGPRGLEPQPDRLLRGRGDGRFEERSREWLPDHVPGFTLAIGAFDADGDGDTDLYVANDSVPNLMLVNGGAGVFRDFGLQAGVAVNQDGVAQAGMGVAFGDVDRDGRLDFAVTNFSDEPTELYFGAEVGFRAATHRIGLGHATRRMLSWGVQLCDFDADGRLELFTANGHVYPQADRPYTGTSYAQKDGLWRIPATGPLQALETSGERALTALVLGSRASAIGDFDGDLAPDLVLTTIDGPAVLAMNRLEPAGNRLALLCLGASASDVAASKPRTPADGRGARVVVVPAVPEGEPPFGLLAEVGTAGSYQASSTPWLHFGLGRATRYERIDIRWPSGRLESLPAGLAGRRLVVREGEGVILSEEP